MAATRSSSAAAWVHDLPYEDDQGRPWRFTAIECQETVNGHTTTFASLTDLAVDARTVVAVATKGGRHRWHIENQGFNRQKNSGLNLEHVCCRNPDLLKAYYLLLQVAHLLLQVLEAGSLLKRLAAEDGQTFWQLFGSLKNLGHRMLACTPGSTPAGLLRVGSDWGGSLGRFGTAVTHYAHYGSLLSAFDNAASIGLRFWRFSLVSLRFSWEAFIASFFTSSILRERLATLCLPRGTLARPI